MPVLPLRGFFATHRHTAGRARPWLHRVVLLHHPCGAARASGGSGRRPDRLRPVTDAPRPARTPPSPHTLRWLVAPVIFLVICSNIANVTWATLQDTHPLLLIALSSINRYLILVSDRLDPVSYYGVGTMRLLVSDPLFFLLGYWYGDRALEWMDSRAPSYGPMLRRLQNLFGKAAWPLVLIAPNNFICLFAGAAGMRVTLFFAVNLIGTVGRLYLIRVLGATFSSPIDSVQNFVAQYRWWLLALSAVGGRLEPAQRVLRRRGDRPAPPPRGRPRRRRRRPTRESLA